MNFTSQNRGWIILFPLLAGYKMPLKPQQIYVREDLEVVITRIELLFDEHNCSWEIVLYIHLYIADMNEFGLANDQYLKFITQEKCRFGVPSRSTIELPLLQAGLGRAYIEVWRKSISV